MGVVDKKATAPESKRNEKSESQTKYAENRIYEVILCVKWSVYVLFDGCVGAIWFE